uniref:Uncharacterized protein n=1 Tax=Anguilla anguilla TaxID=7936 RepID=A0A0E9UNJ9_ANGAN
MGKAGEMNQIYCFNLNNKMSA